MKMRTCVDMRAFVVECASVRVPSSTCVSTLRCSALSSRMGPRCLSELLTRGWEWVEWDLVADALHVCACMCVRACVSVCCSEEESARAVSEWASECGRERAGVRLRHGERQWECVSTSTGQRSSKVMAACSAVCSQSVLSPLEAPAELSCILSWAGPVSRELKEDGEGWGWAGASFITISNKWERRHQALSPFSQKVFFLTSQSFAKPTWNVFTHLIPWAQPLLL